MLIAQAAGVPCLYLLDSINTCITVLLHAELFALYILFSKNVCIFYKYNLNV